MGSSGRRSCNQNELLRVLCASKTSTRRARRLSVTSVFGLFSATENTEKRSWQDNTVPRTSATARPRPQGRVKVAGKCHPEWPHAPKDLRSSLFS